MIFKFLYEGISKRIIFSLLTILQFTIAIICIYASIQYLSDMNNLTKSINSQFGNEKYYKIDDSLAVEDIMGGTIEKHTKNLRILQNINSYFNNNKDIKFMSANTDAIFVSKDEVIPSTVVTYSTVSVDNTEYLRTQGVYINKLFLEKMNYEFIEGGLEGFQEVSNGPIPIIVGSTYKEKYSLGDKIQTILPVDNGEFKKFELKIVGILSENNYLNIGGLNFDKQSLKNSILIPFREDLMMKSSENYEGILSKRIGLFNYMQGGYVILKNNESLDTINDYLYSSGLKFQLKDFNKAIQQYRDESMADIKPAIYVAIIVILFSLTSVIVVMINTISKEKKEYGINIILGATMKDIRNRILAQVILLLLISAIISIMILAKFAIFRFNLIYFIYSLGVLIWVSIIISIVITINLNKYSINDLVRRSE